MMKRSSHRKIAGGLQRLGGRLRRDQRGNVLMIVGFSIIPLTFATGMGIDYSRAMKLQTRLNAAADAAALSGVTQNMMTQTNAAACTAAKNMFVTQSSGLSGLTLDTSDSKQFTMSLTDASGTYDCASNSSALNNKVSLRRTMTVTYRGQSSNAFAGLLAINSLTVKGTSSAFAQISNIDFYVMMDLSQSMLLPATGDGLSSMITATKGQNPDDPSNGCAFACHQTETRPVQVSKTDNKGNATAWSTLARDIANNPILPADAALPNPHDLTKDTRRRIDNYTVARNLGIVLRTDLLGEAVAALAQRAMDTEASNGATYRIGLSSFGATYTQRWPTTGNNTNVANYWVDSNLQNVLNYVNTIGGANYQGWSNQVYTYCYNNVRSCTGGGGDTDTNFTAAITNVLAHMPLKGGTGTKASPQAVLFIVTDGMRDESRPNGYPEGPIPASLCQQILARNVQIAVLETQYLPSAASDSWSITNVKNKYLSPTNTISPALYSCAATPPPGTPFNTTSTWPPPNGINPGVLYYQVTTDGDITTALTSLFDKAVAQARLTN